MATEFMNRGGVGEAPINEPIGQGYLTAKAFEDRVKALGPITRLNCPINCSGGGVIEALGIHAFLTRLSASGVLVATFVQPVALSAGFVVSTAGKERHISADGVVMTHNVQIEVIGDYREAFRQAEAAKTFNDMIGKVTSSAIGVSLEQMLEWMDQETWWDAAQSKAAGIATHIDGRTNATMSLDFSRFRNVPAHVQDLFRKDPPAMSAATFQQLSALPGVTETFICQQLKAGSTIENATSAWMQELVNQADKAKAVIPGVDPVVSSTRQAQAFDDPAAEWDNAVTAELAKVKDRARAVANVARRNPELRKAFVAAHNHEHGRAAAAEAFLAR